MKNVMRSLVISPVLFNIMINDIFSGIGGGFGRSLFTNDGALWKWGRNVDYSIQFNSIYLYSAFNKGALSQSCFTENRPQ